MTLDSLPDVFRTKALNPPHAAKRLRARVRRLTSRRTIAASHPVLNGRYVRGAAQTPGNAATPLSRNQTAVF